MLWWSWTTTGGEDAERRDPQVGTNPAGFSTVVYDDAGNQLATNDQRGARLEFTYDDLNRVRTEVRVVRNATPTPSRFTTTFDYDDLGNVTYQQTPTGDVSTAVFNAASEMTSSTDPGLFATTYVRDVAGRVTQQTDPLGRRAETDYDLAGRAITVRNFDAAGVLMTTRTSGYDAAGNPTSYVSPRGNVAGATAAHFTTIVAYDALSRVTSVTEPTSATTSITASYAYDAAGNISRLTDGRNNATLYAYQAWNLQSTVIEPSTTAHSAIAQRTWTTSFDAGGLPVRLVEPGPVTVNRVFDDLGRLTSETGSGTGAVSATRTMGYDPAGLMTSVNAPGGAISFTYDDRRLLTGSDGPATALDSSFTYDASGRLLSRTDASGASVFTWNSRSLLATVTNPLIAVTATHGYDAAGQRISTSYTGGGTRSYSFDGLGRITNDTLRNSSNAVTAGFDIGYDPDSNIVRRTITLPGNSQQGVHTYGYDNVGRITSWTRPGVAAVPYAWDGSGNLTNHAGVVQTFDQRNRTLSSGSTVWTWSPRGTMATQKIGTAAATNLAFDGLNRMTASSGQAFAYDGLGRVVTNGATAFSYAGFEIDPVAVGTTLIARGPAGEPVSARIGTAAATMLGVDSHQDVTYRFAGAGTVSATRLYEPFGKPTVTSGTMPVIGFQGDYTNPTTGDVWMGARWYKPGTGSFTARDTVFGRLDTPISLNRYTYAWADPLGMWDPDGRCAADNGDDRGKCVEHRKGVARNSGGPGSLAAGHPHGPAVTRDWTVGEGQKFERRISTNYFDNALTPEARIIASQRATWWYHHCQGDWNVCVDIAADFDLEQLSPDGVGLLMALDQLTLEVYVGKLQFEDHELFDDPNIKKLVASYPSARDVLLGTLPDVAMGGASSPAGPSCPPPCISYVPPDVWEGPHDRESARRRKPKSTDPQRNQAHHVVAQNAGNVTKFGLLAVHDKSNLVWLSEAEHEPITSWQNSKTLFPGLTNNDYLSTLDWDEQLAFGQWLMSDPSPARGTR